MSSVLECEGHTQVIKTTARNYAHARVNDMLPRHECECANHALILMPSVCAWNDIHVHMSCHQHIGILCVGE